MAPPFNLNTISNGVSPADFYMTVPSAQIHLLESDAKTKLLAKPQVRGRENAQITLNLGDEIPVADDDVPAARDGRRGDAAAGVVHVPPGRREPQHHAARDLCRTRSSCS